MRPSEWLDIAAWIRRQWHHSPIPDATIQAWGEALADLDASDVFTAVEAFYLDGAAWPPHGGQVRARVAKQQLGAPDWATAKQQLLEVRQRQVVTDWVCPYELCDGSSLIVEEGARSAHRCRCHRERKQARIDQRLAALSHVHPTVAGFVEHVGISELRDIDTDRTAEAQVRDKYHSFVAGRREEITHRQITSRTNQGLHQPDLLKALEAGK